MPLVYIAYDDCLRVRIGKEHLESRSYGPGYGGTGAIRLNQVLTTWFFAYRLDDDGPRGTAELKLCDLELIRRYLPSAEPEHHRLPGIRISETDLHKLYESVEDDPSDIRKISGYPRRLHRWNSVLPAGTTAEHPWMLHVREVLRSRGYEGAALDARIAQMVERWPFLGTRYEL